MFEFSAKPFPILSESERKRRMRLVEGTCLSLEKIQLNEKYGSHISHFGDLYGSFFVDGRFCRNCNCSGGLVLFLEYEKWYNKTNFKKNLNLEKK